MRFTVAEGVGTALSGMNDDRAYWLLSGDLNQMGTMERFLRQRGYPVVKCNVYPGFAENDKANFLKALKDLFEARVPGWWNQQLVEHKVCSQEEFSAALHRE